MFKTTNTAAHTSSPLESADFDGFEYVADVPTFKALTGPQYRAWAKAVGVHEADARAFHQITGKAPEFSHGRPIGETHPKPLLVLAAYGHLKASSFLLQQTEEEEACAADDAVETATWHIRGLFQDMTGHWLS